jgi:hypothetical protein
MRFSPSVIIFCRPSQHNFLVEIKRNQAVRGMIAFRRFGQARQNGGLAR